MATARRVLGAVGATSLLGYGGYWAVQQKEIKQLEREVADLSTLVSKEKKAATSNATLIKENEERAVQLAKQEAGLTTEIKRLDERLEAARSEVSRLEAEAAKKADALQRAQADAKAALSRLSNLRSEGERIHEALTLGEKSLAVARLKASEARSLLNPLNHPIVAGNLSSKRP